MSVIKADGYQAIRDYIEANWTYIELRDGTQAPIVRLPVSDARVTWTHNPGAQTLEVTVVVRGNDADITSLLPKTFAGAAIYKAAVGGVAMSEETFTAFNMASASDQLTVKYQIEVPQIV